MSKLKISLVVPVYNAEKDLPHLFESLMNQTHQIDEVILVDNMSKDGSFRLCKNFSNKNKDKNIVVLQEKSKGPSAARNTGLKKAQHEILALTDADCMLDKDWCSNVLNRFEKDFLYDIIGGIATGTEIFGEEQTFETYTEEFSYYYWTLNRQAQKPFPMNHVDDFFSRAPFTVATYNVAMKRSVFEKTGGFDEQLLNNEDTDWWMRSTMEGFKSLVGIPEIKVCHRNRKELKSLWRQYFNYGEGLSSLLRKYFRGRFLITFRSSKICELPIFTGLLEINPHTLLLFLILFSLLFLPLYFIPLYFLLLFAGRFLLIRRYIRNFAAKFKKSDSSCLYHGNPADSVVSRCFSGYIQTRSLLPHLKNMKDITNALLILFLAVMQYMFIEHTEWFIKETSTEKKEIAKNLPEVEESTPLPPKTQEIKITPPRPDFILINNDGRMLQYKSICQYCGQEDKQIRQTRIPMKGTSRIETFQCESCGKRQKTVIRLE